MDKRPKSLLQSIAEFDWKAATGVLAVLGMAGLFYLGHFFITREQYDSDKLHLQEMLSFRFDQIQKNQEEQNKNLRDILREQRKANP